ncbi:MAG TPA: PDZ domain-containing protein [Pirellulales bacterium]|nr:PDZ domain-containing protein [Pirellulales bacterium]
MSMTFFADRRPCAACIHCLAGAATLLALLTAVQAADAGSRNAVKKALAATVAVEWRAGKKDNLPPQAAAGAAVRTLPPQNADEKTKAGMRGALVARFRTRLDRADQADLSLASGALLSPDGLIATFSHEQGEGRYIVYLHDGRRLAASMLVDDRRTGLRLLKVDGRDLPYLSLAETDAEVGDQVFATFCTDRHERAATQGMISARLHGAGWATSLHVDHAGAGPMSAGGPIVDGDGNLVGLLAGRSASSEPAEVGASATPLDAVRALLKARQGENTVVVQRGLLGLQLNSKSEDDNEQVVVHVFKDSPAEAAGVRDGDELVAVDGHKVASPAEAAALVARHALGEKVAVTLRRDGAEKEYEITIGRPAPEATAAGSADAAPDQPAATANLVHPEQLFVFSPDGKRVAVTLTEQQLGRWRKQASIAGTPPATAAEPAPNIIRVERSDLEKKLEEVGRSVESLQKQVETLTEEIKALRGKLAEQK